MRLPLRVTYWVFIALTWGYTFTRAVPLRDGDRGVFASMAERLAAGDTLYVDVWDNKEPLFFLTLGAGRTISPYMDIVIELGWLLLASLAIYQISRSQKLSSSISALLGFAATPIILTGEIYEPGFSHLPSTAILLGIIALALKNHWVWAGALIPVLIGFKIIVLPLALSALLVIFLLNKDKKSSRTDVIRLAVGALSSGIALSLLLIARGEFRGFIDLIISNVSYSQSNISDAYNIPILKHIEPVFTASAVTVTAAISVILLLTWKTTTSRRNPLWWITLVTLLSSFVVIAITGLWPHHGQILFPAAALSAVLLISTFSQLHSEKLSTFALVTVLAILLAAGPSLRTVIDSALSVRARTSDLTRVAQPTQDLLKLADSGTYQRLGKNTDDSHAFGLRNFTLGCYQFVQYTYDLEKTLQYIPECLPTVDFVIVDQGFVTQPGADRWNEFVNRSNVVLDQDFACEDLTWGRLCERG